MVHEPVRRLDQVLQNVLHNESNAKPISKSILLQQACDEIRELRKKLDASTTIISRFGLENLFVPTPSSTHASPPNASSRIYSPINQASDVLADTRRASISTSATPILYSEEKRKANAKRRHSYDGSWQASDRGSIDDEASASASASSSASCSSSSHTHSDDTDCDDTDTDIPAESALKERTKRHKARSKKERDRTKPRYRPKPSTNRSPTPSSCASSTPNSPPTSSNRNRDLQQAILSLLLELPSHLEDVKNKRRASQPTELADPSSVKSRSKKRHR